ncbi:MAG: mandelate racemase/muconate lactonizing enzyme family protein [Opitutae bacterium]|jgi:D-galactarolactone cycloisomerase|nr:mandelate racemase/muconate lactonizing enzyme family protein [Opitutae bacterium]MDG2345193.1 mandelate racemase/muconate lactonizing enzyme family protein [Opitutae bacterium]
MKISDIQCFPLRTKLSRSIGFSQWYYPVKNNFVLKVTCSDGTVGWGECYGPNLAIAAAVEHHFKPLLLGKNPLQNEVLWNLMWKAFCDFNRHGIFMAAISGLDIAFWDIKGKALNAPVRTLLGGSDEPVPCYATGMYFRDDKPEDEMLEELLEEAAGYVAQGYTMLKVKVGKNLEFDTKLIEGFRSRFPTTKIAADSNHAYNYKEAIRIGRVLEANDYCWFEEPLSPENYADMARLRDQLSVPIAAGECEQTRFGFERLASGACLDIMQPDIAYCGGITEFVKINAIACASHTDMVPHCWGLKINQAVAASAISMVPENPGRFERRAVFLEMDQTEHPVRDSIFSKAHEVIDGKLHFNDLPGLGVEIDEAAMQPFVVNPSAQDESSFAVVE